ncbi:MAG: hypothetical protein EOM68_29445 [Spirochaetia bacterium]|nr:hypothetical protein [Spirochaetia bacterium]
MHSGHWLSVLTLPRLFCSQGNFGFDPLELGKDAESLTLFRQAEVYHCRSVACR